MNWIKGIKNNFVFFSGKKFNNEHNTVMRKKRILCEGARYHVSARINNKELFLETPAFKFLMEHVIARAKKKYNFRIENYVIMNNHFHLIIIPREKESLSRIMQWILSVFAMDYNRLTGHSGHVWGERFFSLILQTFMQYIRTSLYIDNNPLVAGLSDYLGEWPFSALFYKKNNLHSDLLDSMTLDLC